MSTLLGEKRKDRKTYIAERDRQIYERRNKRTHTQNKENTGVKEKKFKKRGRRHEHRKDNNMLIESQLVKTSNTVSKVLSAGVSRDGERHSWY